MKSIFLYLIMIFITSLSSCSDGDSAGLLCAGFDQRQCQGDDWASDAVEDDDLSMVIATYLEDQGVSVDDVIVIDRFYDAVCEACFVCPMDHRIFVKIDSSDFSNLNGLDLLNLQREDCDVF